MQRSAAPSIEIAHRPIASTDFLTNSTSTSVAYSLNSSNTCLGKMRGGFAGHFPSMRTENTLISSCKISGYLWITKFMFRSATNCISDSALKRVTRGGASFLTAWETTSDCRMH